MSVTVEQIKNSKVREQIQNSGVSVETYRVGIKEFYRRMEVVYGMKNSMVGHFDEINEDGVCEFVVMGVENGEFSIDQIRAIACDVMA